ncbi:YIP1 family protein [Streptomyces sp. XM4193]|uniref:Yip1 family protein n=1 Tax=Streptomyces sp. XM4193 TaxID=2929782 RepID=UPI001FF80226|nr:Yip1 family protein [Streptomyces sp. XM4193]MCK1794749.1 YIP1 family protein [Streptomyces sp. XM4193]
MAGFRIGRGRDPRNGQQAHPAQQPTQPGYGQQGAPNGAPGAHDPHRAGGQQYGHHVPYAPHPTQPGHGPDQGYGPDADAPYGHGRPPADEGPWQQSHDGGPEYFDHRFDPGQYANSPGHTAQFRVDDSNGYDDPGYSGGNTYVAGRDSAPPAGPRLHWKQLLSGIVLRPNPTFWQMRDHSVWATALIVTFLYGLLAVFGLDKPREDVLNSTLANAVPTVLITGAAVTICFLILSSVTHTLARQFGGDGAWAPTVGLAMLISCLTEAPRLLFALFLGGDAGFVQLLGWATWLAAGFLFTSMVSRSHDLPWQKALGASSIQLIAMLVLIKLGTL